MDWEALIFLALGGLGLYFLFEGDSTDTSSWPPAPNAQVAALAAAIALAEGSGANNNPGDLTAGDVPSASIVSTFNSAGVVNIDTLANGVNALYNKLVRIQNGNSPVYSLDMAISDFAYTYTGGDNSDGWAATVAGQLGVSTDDTLGDVLG